MKIHKKVETGTKSSAGSNDGPISGPGSPIKVRIPALAGAVELFV